MKVTHGIATVIVGVGITASGVLFSQAWGGASASSPTVSTAPAPAPASMSAIVAAAADQAALVQLCIYGLHDSQAAAAYEATAAAHPALAAGIRANCVFAPLAP